MSYPGRQAVQLVSGSKFGSKQVEQSVEMSRLWRHLSQLAEGSYLLLHTISPSVELHDSIRGLLVRVAVQSLPQKPFLQVTLKLIVM